jgi:hypothetical protein
MAVRGGINGFGPIGRLVYRAMCAAGWPSTGLGREQAATPRAVTA